MTLIEYSVVEACRRRIAKSRLSHKKAAFCPILPKNGLKHEFSSMQMRVVGTIIVAEAMS